jgi:hypothetical protein
MKSLTDESVESMALSIGYPYTHKQALQRTLRGVRMVFHRLTSVTYPSKVFALLNCVQFVSVSSACCPMRMHPDCSIGVGRNDVSPWRNLRQSLPQNWSSLHHGSSSSSLSSFQRSSLSSSSSSPLLRSDWHRLRDRHCRQGGRRQCQRQHDTQQSCSAHSARTHDCASTVMDT